jgi:hypothetical protein
VPERQKRWPFEPSISDLTAISVLILGAMVFQLSRGQSSEPGQSPSAPEPAAVISQIDGGQAAVFEEGKRERTALARAEGAGRDLGTICDNFKIAASGRTAPSHYERVWADLQPVHRTLLDLAANQEGALSWESAAAVTNLAGVASIYATVLQDRRTPGFPSPRQVARLKALDGQLKAGMDVIRTRTQATGHP